MTVSFEGVKAGDRVKLTRANADEAAIRVDLVSAGKTMIEDTHGNGFYHDEWDTVEILEKSLPTVQGYYMPAEVDEGSDTGLYYLYVAPGGSRSWSEDQGTEWKDVDESEVPRNLVRLVKES